MKYERELKIIRETCFRYPNLSTIKPDLYDNSFARFSLVITTATPMTLSSWDNICGTVMKELSYYHESITVSSNFLSCFQCWYYENLLRYVLTDYATLFFHRFFFFVSFQFSNTSKKKKEKSDGGIQTVHRRGRRVSRSKGPRNGPNKITIKHRAMTATVMEFQSIPFKTS